MTAALARDIASAISEGINHLAFIRSLKASPPVAEPAEIDDLRTTLDNLQCGLKAVLAGEVVTSFRVSGDLLRSIEALQSHLSVISPGAPVPSTLFNLVDLAWAEFEKVMGTARAAPASGEPPRMTIEEWAAMPEDEPGELVGGYLVEEEMADFEHETIVSFLNAALRTWVAPKGGFVAGSEAKLAVGPEQGRKPDLTVYLPGGNIPPRRGPIRVPPDIVIEVEGPTSLDARRDFEKEQDYAAFGIRWCWHIDPASRCLMVRELQSDRRYKTVVSTVHRCGAIPGCADLTIDLDALWDELDRLGPPGS